MHLCLYLCVLDTQRGHESSEDFLRHVLFLFFMKSISALLCSYSLQDPNHAMRVCKKKESQCFHRKICCLTEFYAS